MTGFASREPGRRARSALGLAVAMVVAFAVLALGTTPAPAQSCSENPDIQVDQDACSETVAVSGTGNASGVDCSGQVSCISASGTGDVSNTGGERSCGRAKSALFDSPEKGLAAGCVAASGSGDASNSTGDFSCGVGWGGSVAAGCVAVSVVGDASNSTGYQSCGQGFIGVMAGCVAASGGQSASNSAGRSSCASSQGLTTLVGCVAVSGLGDASNSAGDSASPFSRSCGTADFLTLSLGCVAVSGAGQTSNNVTGDRACGSAYLGMGVGCVAASGAGDASNSGGDDSCGSSEGTDSANTIDPVPPLLVPAGAAGCVAASGTGDASNSAGTNSCGYAVAEAAAIGCVEVDGQDPVRVTVGGAHGCVVTAGYSCTFRGNGAFAPNGVISATSGSWAVTHQVGSTTVTDVSGTGPNALPFPFADGVLYTLTVGADGAGIVAAGSPT